MENFILTEKYAKLLKKESSWSLSDGQMGSLFLVSQGIYFAEGTTFLARYSNHGNDSLPDYQLYVGIEDIASVEIGKFKNLWTFIYTLRIYLKNGTRYSFMLNDTREGNVKIWVDEISRLLKEKN